MGLSDRILAASDLRHEDVFVPEWNETVRVMELDALSRVEWDDERSAAATAERKSDSSIYSVVRFLRRALVDPAGGGPIFSESQLSALARKSHRILLRLFRVAMRLNAATEVEVDAMAGKSVAGEPAAPPTA